MAERPAGPGAGGADGPADPVRSLGYRTDLMLLSLQGSTIEDVGDAWVIRSPHNPAFHWGNFLLVKQGEFAGVSSGDRIRRVGGPDGARHGVEGWLRRFELAFPDATHRCLGVDEPDGVLTPAVVSSLGAAGLEAERSTVMVGRAGDVAGGLGPDGVECRPLSTDTEWEASVELEAAENTDYPAGEFRTFVTDKMRAFRALQEQGSGAWFGAFVDGQLACELGLFTDGSRLARFQSVLTASGFRRRGLARALVAHACRVAAQRWGVQHFVMVADPGYHAITLYRSLGFVDAEVQLAISRPAD